MNTLLLRRAAFPLVLASFALTACGGDDGGGGGDGTAANAQASSCVAGMMSTPGAAGDPCASVQGSPVCNGQPARAKCAGDGTWKVSQQFAAEQAADPALACRCDPPPAVCGNGVVEGTEVCDGSDLGGQTCATLVPGTQGQLVCNNCNFDMSGCFMPQTAGGAGNDAMGGAPGAGGGGTGG